MTNSTSTSTGAPSQASTVASRRGHALTKTTPVDHVADEGGKRAGPTQGPVHDLAAALASIALQGAADEHPSQPGDASQGIKSASRPPVDGTTAKALLVVSKQHERFYYVLDHAYPDRALLKSGISGLQGRDALVVATLQAANATLAVQDQFSFFLAQAERSVYLDTYDKYVEGMTWDSNLEEEVDEDITIAKLHSLNGRRAHSQADPNLTDANILNPFNKTVESLWNDPSLPFERGVEDDGPFQVTTSCKDVLLVSPLSLGLIGFLGEMIAFDEFTKCGPPSVKNMKRFIQQMALTRPPANQDEHHAVRPAMVSAPEITLDEDEAFSQHAEVCSDLLDLMVDTPQADSVMVLIKSDSIWSRAQVREESPVFFAGDEVNALYVAHQTKDIPSFAFPEEEDEFERYLWSLALQLSDITLCRLAVQRHLNAPMHKLRACITALSEMHCQRPRAQMPRPGQLLRPDKDGNFSRVQLSQLAPCLAPSRGPKPATRFGSKCPVPGRLFTLTELSSQIVAMAIDRRSCWALASTRQTRPTADRESAARGRRAM
ncbi:hypothetical protein V8E36_007247 [Tilletia maclaganii]